MIAALRKVPIFAPGGGSDALGSKANANYTVAISDSEAREAAQAADDKRDESRMVPLEKKDGGLDRTDSRRSGAQNATTQKAAINDLTSRPPAYDIGRDEAWDSSRGDTDTIGDRPSIDRQDAEEVRGILHKESTKGRRHADSTSELRQSMSLRSTRSPAETRFPVATQRDQPQSGSAAAQSSSTDINNSHYPTPPAFTRPQLNTAPTGYSTYATPPQVPYNPMSPLVEGQTPVSSTSSSGMLRAGGQQQQPQQQQYGMQAGPMSGRPPIGQPGHPGQVQGQVQGQGQARAPHQRKYEDV